jgi:hypothetical protein
MHLIEISGVFLKKIIMMNRIFCEKWAGNCLCVPFNGKSEVLPSLAHIPDFVLLIRKVFTSLRVMCIGCVQQVQGFFCCESRCILLHRMKDGHRSHF